MAISCKYFNLSCWCTNYCSKWKFDIDVEYFTYIAKKGF